ncbi:WbqC family protein [Erythrobacter sp.]|uniref:WbqC family protein n=1 Tax=Erythrobacter sp. TaxID=1042 RepID=UPI002EA29DAF|nr:WbqC family protein [Erythrobacter sp.]
MTRGFDSARLTAGDAAGPKGPRVVVMQPYFLPSIAYFHLLHAADIFVFFDDAQFVTKRFTHRNSIPLDDGEYRFTVPLRNRSQNRRIDEIALHPEQYPHWRRKFLASLRMHYGPSEAIEELAELMQSDDIGLARLAERSVKWAAQRIGLTPDYLRSSEIDYDRGSDASGKMLSICRQLGAHTYVNAWGGRALYERPSFEREGFDLVFARSSGDAQAFIAQSILALILTLEPRDIRRYAASYDLVRVTQNE